MGLTELVRRQTPHLTPVLVLGTAAFCAPAFTVFAVECKSMAKDKAIISPWFELCGAVGLSASAGFNGLFLWMNQTWGRYSPAKDEEYKKRLELTETAWARQQTEAARK